MVVVEPSVWDSRCRAREAYFYLYGRALRCSSCSKCIEVKIYTMLTNVRFEDLKNIENVKTAVEHISLYVGLVVFTALGAKVGL